MAGDAHRHVGAGDGSATHTDAGLAGVFLGAEFAVVTRGTVGLGRSRAVAGVANAVLVGVRLGGVGLLRAVVNRVGDTIAIGVERADAAKALCVEAFVSSSAGGAERFLGLASASPAVGIVNAVRIGSAVCGARDGGAEVKAAVLGAAVEASALAVTLIRHFKHGVAARGRRADSAGRPGVVGTLAGYGRAGAREMTDVGRWAGDGGRADAHARLAGIRLGAGVAIIADGAG